MGKTSVVRSWAQYITSPKGPKKFKGAHLFEMQLGSFTQFGNVFENVYDDFKRHRLKAMFFIDELYALFQNNTREAGSSLPHELLKFHNHFRYVIAATTKNEFEELNQNPKNQAFMAPFKRRFKIIEIKPPTEDQVKASLYQILQNKAPEILKEAGVISYIIEKANHFNPQASQIDAAHSDSIQGSPLQHLDDEIDQLDSEIEDREMYLVQEDNQVDPSSYLNKKKELQAKKENRRQKQQQLQQIKKIENLLLKNKKERYLMASKMSSYLSNSATMSIKPWLQLEIMKEILEQSIKYQKKQLGLYPMLDKNLIDSLISEEKKLNGIK